MKGWKFFLLCLAIVVAALLLWGPKGCAQGRDTTFHFTDTTIHHFTATVPVDTIWQRDTLYIHDTIYLPPTQGGKRIYWSTWEGSFASFIQSVVNTQDTAVIDKDVMPSAPMTIEGNVAVIGSKQPTITHGFVPLFMLKKGDHYFSGFDINQTPGGIAYSTITQNNIIWNNTIRNTTVTGGRQVYTSSLGGVYDPAKDSVLQWAGTTIENAVFKTGYVPVQIFSQDGPAKFFHARNLDMYCDTGHNLYIHPNVSLRLYNVRSMKIRDGLALHHYSGGGGDGSGVISNPKYVYLNHCYSDPKSGGTWQIDVRNGDSIRLDTCNLALYSIPVKPTKAVACNFINRGSGSYFRGLAVNCTGTIWPVEGTTVQGGNFAEVNLRGGGHSLVKGATIKDVWADKAGAYSTTFDNCGKITLIGLSPPYGQIFLKNTTYGKVQTTQPPIPEGVINIIHEE